MMCSREEIRRQLAAQYETRGQCRARAIGNHTWSPAVAVGFLAMIISAVGGFIALVITLAVR
jgi:hypothetical protein